MTSNQIAYAKVQEEGRHNQVVEGETNRSNLANERIGEINAYENIRHNTETEKENNRANLAREAENYRSNLAKETENYRHNVRTENISEKQVNSQVALNAANRELALRKRDSALIANTIAYKTGQSTIDAVEAENKANQIIAGEHAKQAQKDTGWYAWNHIAGTATQAARSTGSILSGVAALLKATA